MATQDWPTDLATLEQRVMDTKYELDAAERDVKAAADGRKEARAEFQSALKVWIAAKQQAESAADGKA